LQAICVDTGKFERVDFLNGVVGFMAARVIGKVDIWLIFVWVLIETIHYMLSYQGLGE
jgi:hypothetical protein